jgi:hypothetical protein
LFGDRVVWGGVQYAIHRGRMSPISSSATPGGSRPEP